MSRAVLILSLMSTGSSSLECGCISVALSAQKLENNLESLFEIFALLMRLSLKHFDTLKFKIKSIYDLTKFRVGVVLYGGP